MKFSFTPLLLIPILATSWIATTPMAEAAKSSQKTKKKQSVKAKASPQSKSSTEAASSSAATPEPMLPSDAVDRRIPPPAGPLPKVTLPDVLTETLQNGLRVFILADHRQPTVTYRLVIKSGALFDGEKQGLAALTADLLNKGTQTLSAEAFAEQTDFLGISVEASASDDALSIIASGLSRDHQAILNFLKEASLFPLFKKEELEKEKLRAISSLKQKEASPSELAARLRNKLIFGDHPYGKFETVKTVQSITRDDLEAFHKTHFLPNNASLVVVGDLDPKATLEQIKAAFGDWKEGDLPKLTLPNGKPVEEGRLSLPPFPVHQGISYHVLDRPASIQSNILVAAPGIARNNPDLPEISVVNSVLGGAFSGRLFSNLREKHGFTYGSYSGFSPRKWGGAFTASAEVRNNVTKAAIDEILKEIKQITVEPIPEAELGQQRNYLVGNYLMSLENHKRIAERLQEIDLYGLPKDFYETFADRLANVSTEKALELAKTYFHPDNLVVVIVGNAKEILPQLKGVEKVTLYNTQFEEIPCPPEEKKE